MVIMIFRIRKLFCIYPENFTSSFRALTFSQKTNFRPFQTEEFADDSFKFGDKNCGKFSLWVENTVGKGKTARYEQFLLFPQCFRKRTCAADT